jgi:predicted acyltransferase
VATTLLGIVAGLWLGSAESAGRKTAGLFAAGIAGILAGYLWHVVFPINKNLWTSSYVLFTAGAALLLLALCYWIIDVRGWRGWTKPLVILGTNAITLYVASGLLVETLAHIHVAGAGGRDVSLSHYIYVQFFLPLAAPKVASLLYAVAHLMVLFGLLAWMYRRRLFLRV